MTGSANKLSLVFGGLGRTTQGLFDFEVQGGVETRVHWFGDSKVGSSGYPAGQPCDYMYQPGGLRKMSQICLQTDVHELPPHN